MSWFDPQYFLEHCTPERTQHKGLPAYPASTAHGSDASQDCSQKSSFLAAPSQVSTKRHALTQCSGKAIDAATRDKPLSLRLGGFVTA